MSNRGHKNELVINTDGSCRGNGQDGARAGYGVYCRDDPRVNCSERLDGRQTNQRAELTGAQRGVERARDLGYKEVRVKTDSDYVVKGMNEWLPKWERDGYSKEPTNLREFQDLKEATSGMQVTFEHTSREYNSAADSLARKGADLPPRRGY